MSGSADHTRAARQGQPNVFSRLQALFPPSPVIGNSATLSQNEVVLSPRLQSPKKPCKFMKVRILTWNMHDSLPKGDLEELLDTVSPYDGHGCGAPAFPPLSMEPAHPYHLVVIAGQECPSSSGIPMGLGAGIKIGVADREKEDREHKEHHEKHHSHHIYHHKRKDKERGEGFRGWKSADDLSESASPLNQSGWTSALDHWLCHRTQANHRVSNGHASQDTTPSPKRQSLHRHVTVRDRGPYQHLIKERMMGLYLSVYVHRDLSPLVQGTSKSAVTAGLIGGRVGNKGGVGISLKIDGTTFLFLNAHLAAHEGKVHHRLANLSKIKSELAVEDFLQLDDPRMMAEDITDKFDFTFLCGDLNFRLDITRLHADWLISRQEYAQAFAFDQLKKQMETNTAFSGFHEAPINFPPTFKYDVMGRSKTKRRRVRRTHGDKDVDSHETEKENADEEENAEEGDGESHSLTSSAWTFHSKGIASGSEPDEEDYFTAFASGSAVTEGNRIPFHTAAHKAKARWKAMLSPSVVPAPAASPMARWVRAKNAFREAIQPASPFNHKQPPSLIPSLEDLPVNGVDSASRHSGLLQIQDRASRLAVHGQSAKSLPEQGFEGGDRAVYDSSHKQRVPSWCDRILWKSTLRPNTSDTDPEIPEITKYRTRVSTLITQAFRPLSARVRRDSGSSRNSVELFVEQKVPTRPSISTSRTMAENTTLRPLSFNLSKPPRPLQRHRSIGSVDVTTENEHTSLQGGPQAQALDIVALQTTGAAQINKPVDFPGNNSSLGPSFPGDEHAELISAKDPMPTPLTSTRWRFFPFRRDTSQTVATQDSIASTPTLVPRPARGDVVCLSYNSLDDHGMRRLEARSDHRPVIGSYAVYL